jgi:hypothetical protein
MQYLGNNKYVPSEIEELILLELDPSSLNNICKTCKHFYRLTSSSNKNMTKFFLKKYKHDISQSHSNIEYLGPGEINVMYKKKYFMIMKQYYILSYDERLKFVISNNYEILFLRMLKFIPEKTISTTNIIYKIINILYKNKNFEMYKSLYENKIKCYLEKNKHFIARFYIDMFINLYTIQYDNAKFLDMIYEYIPNTQKKYVVTYLFNKYDEIIRQPKCCIFISWIVSKYKMNN